MKNTIHKNIANRRRFTAKAVKRKARILRECHHEKVVPNLGELDKAKVHCSCPLCSAKSSSILVSKRSRKSCNSKTLKNYSDLKAMTRADNQLKEYSTDAAAEPEDFEE